MTADPIFYSLPAYALEEGMSTSDGQDILGDVHVEKDGMVWYSVFTPRSDDEAQHLSNMEETETRIDTVWERVELAVFPDTDVDGSELPDALLIDQDRKDS